MNFENLRECNSVYVKYSNLSTKRRGMLELKFIVKRIVRMLCGISNNKLTITSLEASNPFHLCTVQCKIPNLQRNHIILIMSNGLPVRKYENLY